MSALSERVRAWIALDPDEEDRQTLQSLLDSGDNEALAKRFDTPLMFGTAGLRGPEMAGPAAMNRATVRRATLGVLAWLEEIGLDATRGVVVGRDARHGSERFNDEVVAVLLGAGATVFEMPNPLPTPLVPYCVKQLGAAAGIMITASHNPPQDNGYKLYAADGSQIIAPDDETVEAFMGEAREATLGDRTSLRHFVVAPELLEQYRHHLLERFRIDEGSDLRITYTPLHGVGGNSMMSLFADAGYDSVTRVEEQFVPDGDFPTLPFPNPEEPGALDLAIATATASSSTLIIANDPDADRLGAACYGAEGWHVLRGDEIGWLLASFLIDDIARKNQMLATTIVSSTLLKKMAATSSVAYATTLTGFKWIARAAGEGVLGFGYEEALGFAVDSSVGDKDGLSGALALTQLAHELALSGRTLLDRLDDIETLFGVHSTSQISLRAEGAEGLASIRRVVERVRLSPPTMLGSLTVTEVVDLTKGWQGLAPTDGVWWTLGELGRVVVRPSGTEAKLKAYIEVTPAAVGSLNNQRGEASAIIERVRADLVELLRV